MSCFKRAWRRLFGKRERRVLLLGLDSAGKTTVLYQLMKRTEATVPTIGFNVERVSVPPIEFFVWDVSGQDRLRVFWRHYYHGTNGIIFVVDCNDRARLPLAARELANICSESELSGACLLVLANKIDMPNACSTEELKQALGIDKLPGIENRAYFIQQTQANVGVGIKEGIKWLAGAMMEEKKHEKEKEEEKS